MPILSGGINSWASINKSNPQFYVAVIHNHELNPNICLAETYISISNRGLRQMNPAFFYFVTESMLYKATHDVDTKIRSCGINRNVNTPFITKCATALLNSTDKL